MSLELRTAYWDDRESREAFKRFILKIHNLDFSAWEQAGFWDDAYRPFSYFHDGEIVSSVCIYSLPAVIDGRRTKLVQISGVGTLPSYRRQGLSRALTDEGLAWAENDHEGVFLFSDQDAIPYYQRCGFTAMEEYLPTVEIEPGRQRDGAMPLGKGDLVRIRKFAEMTTPVSDRFTVGNWKLFMFHALYTLPGKILEIPALNCLVCCERKKGRLQIYQILGQTIPTFRELAPYIAGPGDHVVDFHFLPDRLDLDVPRRRPLTGNNLYVKPGFPVADPVFPYTSRA